MNCAAGVVAEGVGSEVPIVKEVNPITLVFEVEFYSIELVPSQAVESFEGVRVGDGLMASGTEEELCQWEDGDVSTIRGLIHGDIRESEIRVRTIGNDWLIHGGTPMVGKIILYRIVPERVWKLVKGQYFLYHQENKSSREYYGFAKGKSDGKDRVAL